MLVNYDALMRIHHTHDGFGSSGVEAYESSCIAHNAANWRRAGTSSIEGPHGVHLRVVRRCDYLDRTVCAVKRSETGKSGFEIPEFHLDFGTYKQPSNLKCQFWGFPSVKA
jgi:hypothetical protein